MIWRRVGSLSRRPWGRRGVATVPPAPYDVLFCGSDAFACEAVAAIAHRPDLYRSLHVLTPPDVQHAWGAKRMRVSPVKQFAILHNIPQTAVPPEGIDAYEPPSLIRDSHAPLLVTASFGHRIPAHLLSHFPSPSLTLNRHPSMLPDLRGAAPLQWAIARQYTHTGMSVQQLHPTHFDRGGLLKQVRVPIPSHATYPALATALAPHAAELLVDVIAHLPSYAANVQTQNPDRVTRAPKLAPRFSHIRWDSWDAATLDARMRAFGYAQPLTTTLVPASSQFAPVSCAIHEGHIMPSESISLDRPGHAVFLPQEQTLALQTLSGVYGATRIQTRGKPVRSAADWWRGFRDRADAHGHIHFE